jgi:serine/threonine protein kinase
MRPIGDDLSFSLSLSLSLSLSACHPKVADFGLATVRDSVRRTITNLTSEVSRKGTTCYLAPEKMRGRVPDQPSADEWSFGCVIANIARRSCWSSSVDARITTPQCGL